MGMFTSDNQNTETTQDNDVYSSNQQGNTSPVNLAGVKVGGVGQGDTTLNLSILDGGAIAGIKDVAVSVVGMAANTLGMTERAILSSADSAEIISRSALEFAETSSVGALDFVENMSRSDDSQNLELLIKTGAVVGSLALAYLAWKGGMFK